MSDKLSIQEVRQILENDEITGIQASINIADPVLEELWFEAQYKFNKFNVAYDELQDYLYGNSD